MRWGGLRVSFMLVDEGVYRAVVGTLDRGDRGGEVPVVTAALAARPLADLLREAFPRTDLTCRLYAGLSQEEWELLRGDLVNFVIFQHWGTPLHPIDVEEAGQLIQWSVASGQWSKGATLTLRGEACPQGARLPRNGGPACSEPGFRSQPSESPNRSAP